ncbi:uncharacterized protein LOC5572393 [Aedes aegypti]|uniref:Peptidase S1 domain-containing protein n=1 Tax=Aedes aegypti TaxID=7159 RepID=A0A903VRH7_AEDAE|nr:uncharacterized protein LOC5572393 [Aedes aegypti]
MRLPVEYSSTVIPICLDQNVDRDLRELEGERGWVTGWGKTENGILSEVLRTASLPVVKHLECLLNDRLLFGHVLNDNVFCAGNRNGTSPFPGDSGGGMYFNDGDRWILRGIIAFGKINELRVNDPLKFTMFVNIQWYMPWINEVFAESEPKQDKRQKRISELECERFQTLTRKRRNGDCFNNRFRHNVMLVNEKGDLVCNGVLVEESHVVTTCKCIRSASHPVKVRIEANGDKAFAEINCHPKFVDNSKHYDLAILKLNAPVRLSNDLIPACLANNWTENLYDILVQTSFVTESLVSDHMTLVETDENRISLYEVCDSLRGSTRWFNRSDQTGELCVISSDQLIYETYPVLRHSSSSGAILQTSNRRSCMSTIVGLKVSNEGGNGIPDRFSVDIYARISSHVDWIEQIIWNVQPKVDALLPSLDVDFECGVYDHEGWNDEWPWSVAIFHRNPSTGASTLTCSGTLISLKHVLTTAECVVNRTTGIPLPEEAFELHFGLYHLDQRNVNEQVRYASEVHVHPEHSVNNVAILVTNWTVRSPPYVSQICIVPENNADFWNLEGKRVYVTGWQTVETGNPNNDHQSWSIHILGREACDEVSLSLLGNQSTPGQYCSDYPYEDDLSIADRGSGLYHRYLEGPLLGIWVLAGMVSSEVKGNDTDRYTMIVSLQPYIKWIDGILTDRKTRRISERECDRFNSMSQKASGVCENAGSTIDGNPPHVVKLLNEDRKFVCLGVLVEESHILTSCQCTRHPHRPTKAEMSNHSVLDVSGIICHPDNNPENFYSDVAVLKLATPIQVTSQLIPACLANARTEKLKDAMLQTLLVRSLDSKKPSPQSKYEYIGTEEECDKILPPHYKDQFFTPNQACVISPRLEADQFNGSIVQSVDSRACSFTVVGIGSSAVDNSDLGSIPNIGIVNRVALALDWIEEVVWEEEFPTRPNWTLVEKVTSGAAAGRSYDPLEHLYIVVSPLLLINCLLIF